MAAALQLVDTEGVDGLTVRRLGEELDTGSATLYWHIGSKDELAELVYDHVMGEIDLPEPDPAHWEDQIRDLARQVYRVMLRHNDLVRLSLGRIPVGPNTLRVIDWALGLARAAGVPDQAAGYFGDILSRFIDASVLESATAGGAPPEQVGAYFMGLPADRFPNIAATRDTMFTGDDEDRFEFGLDLLIRGLGARVPARRPATRQPRRRG